VALHLAEGLSNAAILRAMAVSENTLRSHLRRAFEKSGATNRPEVSHCVMAVPRGC